VKLRADLAEDSKTTVYLNGMDETGKAELDSSSGFIFREWDVGHVDIEVSHPNYHSWTGRKSVRDGKNTLVVAKLEPLPGELIIYAKPEDATILLNNVDKGRVGKGPRVLSDVAAEEKLEVTARLDGYREQSQIIKLEAGSSRRVDFGSLVEKSGSLLVKLRADLVEDPETKVFLDDADETAKAVQHPDGWFFRERDVGGVAIEVSHPNYHSWTSPRSVSDGEKTLVEVVLKPKDAELRLEVSSKKTGRPLTGVVLWVDRKKVLDVQGAYKIPAEKHVNLQLSAKGHKPVTFPPKKYTANEKFKRKLELEQANPLVVGKNFTVESVDLSMIWVDAGTFKMGSPEGISRPRVVGFVELEPEIIGNEKGRDLDELEHMVTLGGFWLGKHEVTQGQWERLMGTSPSIFQGNNRPVEKVSWHDAVSFCKKVTQQESWLTSLPEGWSYQLPTEAQWEYACRCRRDDLPSGFPSQPFSFGTSLMKPMAGSLRQTPVPGAFGKLKANFNGKQPYGTVLQGPYLERTMDVGSYSGNRFGFHDMHGNVREWCQDWYGSYPKEKTINPGGPVEGPFRVVRGGSWNDSAVDVRSARRFKFKPDVIESTIGFRVSLRPHAGKSE
jgi:formylglycine-generating enzyme required for sulfatase activity